MTALFPAEEFPITQCHHTVTVNSHVRINCILAENGGGYHELERRSWSISGLNGSVEKRKIGIQAQILEINSTGFKEFVGIEGRIGNKSEDFTGGRLENYHGTFPGSESLFRQFLYMTVNGQNDIKAVLRRYYIITITQISTLDVDRSI